MQVLDTAIHTGPEDVLVEFLGEGGEKIAVTMILSDSRLKPDGAALLSRAKQMMVQCAVFSVAPDEYSRKDNALPDRPTGPTEATGPYTFEYYDEGNVRTLEAVDLPSLAAAHDEALRSAIDLLDDPASPSSREDWAVRVRDGSGNVVLSIDFEEARRAKSAVA
ncbi:DUF6894 family protein [Mesorhizobium sp. ORM8.1]|jgi:hypothetical protein